MGLVAYVITQLVNGSKIIPNHLWTKKMYISQKKCMNISTNQLNYSTFCRSTSFRIWHVAHSLPTINSTCFKDRTFQEKNQQKIRLICRVCRIVWVGKLYNKRSCGDDSLVTHNLLPQPQSLRFSEDFLSIFCSLKNARALFFLEAREKRNLALCAPKNCHYCLSLIILDVCFLVKGHH